MEVCLQDEIRLRNGDIARVVHIGPRIPQLTCFYGVILVGGVESYSRTTPDIFVEMNDIDAVTKPKGSPEQRICISDRVRVRDRGEGIVRYLGFEYDPNEPMAGIEFERRIGDTDGTIGGRYKFVCQPRYGLFVPLRDVEPIYVAEIVNESDPRCLCGAIMTQLPAKKCYAHWAIQNGSFAPSPDAKNDESDDSGDDDEENYDSSRGVLCDICDALLVGRKPVWHCPLDKTATHPIGWDFCVDSVNRKDHLLMGSDPIIMSAMSFAHHFFDHFRLENHADDIAELIDMNDFQYVDVSGAVLNAEEFLSWIRSSPKALIPLAKYFSASGNGEHSARDFGDFQKVVKLSKCTIVQHSSRFEHEMFVNDAREKKIPPPYEQVKWMEIPFNRFWNSIWVNTREHEIVESRHKIRMFCSPFIFFSPQWMRKSRSLTISIHQYPREEDIPYQQVPLKRIPKKTTTDEQKQMIEEPSDDEDTDVEMAEPDMKQSEEQNIPPPPPNPFPRSNVVESSSDSESDDHLMPLTIQPHSNVVENVSEDDEDDDETSFYGHTPEPPRSDLPRPNTSNPPTSTTTTHPTPVFAAPRQPPPPPPPPAPTTFRSRMQALAEMQQEQWKPLERHWSGKFSPVSRIFQENVTKFTQTPNDLCHLILNCDIIQTLASQDESISPPDLVRSTSSLFANFPLSIAYLIAEFAESILERAVVTVLYNLHVDTILYRESDFHELETRYSQQSEETLDDFVDRRQELEEKSRVWRELVEETPGAPSVIPRDALRTNRDIWELLIVPLILMQWRAGPEDTATHSLSIQDRSAFQFLANPRHGRDIGAHKMGAMGFEGFRERLARCDGNFCRMMDGTNSGDPIVKRLTQYLDKKFHFASPFEKGDSLKYREFLKQRLQRNYQGEKKSFPVILKNIHVISCFARDVVIGYVAQDFWRDRDFYYLSVVHVPITSNEDCTMKFMQGTFNAKPAFEVNPQSLDLVDFFDEMVVEEVESDVEMT